MFCDAALIYDPVARRCDCTLSDDGDLLLDETPLTPMLLSAGLDRRADPDDDLPEGITAFLAPPSFSIRRGAPSDALDPDGELAGNKCWLLDRAKETETTRLLYEAWLRPAFDWVLAETGQRAQISVQWLRPLTLGWRVRVMNEELEMTRQLAG